jgi:hypothetical protein
VNTCINKINTGGEQRTIVLGKKEFFFKKYSWVLEAISAVFLQLKFQRDPDQVTNNSVGRGPDTEH